MTHWRELVKEDREAVLQRDPAAKSMAEVMLCYPGLKALKAHRRANVLFRKGHVLLARMLSQRARHQTGIEIHPGAEIGRRVFIDHGDGVVIGETTIIGDDVTIYQGVTLGGTGKDVGKRHPTIGNNVMISSGAKVLGPFKVGDNSRIASGAIVLEEVPPNCTAAGVPARIVRRGGAKVAPLDQVHIPDPVAEQLCRLDCRIRQLEKVVSETAPERLKELPPLDINCPTCENEN